MRIYPDTPSRRRAAIVRDVMLVALLLALGLLGFTVYETVGRLAVLGQGLRDAGDSISQGFERAAEAVEETPLVGGELAESLREAGEGTGGNVSEFGRRGEERVQRVAVVLGVVVFVVPALILLAQEIPGRVRQGRSLEAAELALGRAGPERRRLLAMRAAFSLPYDDLLRHTPDPFGDLAEGRYDALAAAALEDAGLRPRDRDERSERYPPQGGSSSDRW